MTSYKVTIINEDEGLNTTIEVPEDEYILDAAEEAELELPFSCRAGACSACVAEVEGGTAGKIDQDEQGLISGGLEEKYILTCVSYAIADCTIYTHKEEELY